MHSHFRERYCGDVAQSVEQRTENPCVGGSIPSITTKILQESVIYLRVFCFYNISYGKSYNNRAIHYSQTSAFAIFLVVTNKTFTTKLVYIPALAKSLPCGLTIAFRHLDVLERLAFVFFVVVSV